MASSNAHWGRRIGITLALVVVGVATWVLPAVYDARYNPETKNGGAAAAAEVAPQDPSWHPIPTAEQDQTYLEQTRLTATHPGLAVDGKDGYLFLGDDFQANFAQAMGRRYYSRDEVQQTVDAVKSRNAWLEQQGIASEFFVVPAKWSGYADKMPAWTDGQVMPHVLDQLITADSSSFPDLRPPLIAGRATADTYSALNSHWTQFGAFVGFQAIIDRLENDHPDLGALPVPTLVGTTTEDTNNEFAGITGAPGPNNWTVPEFSSPVAPYTLIKSDGTQSTVPGDTLIDITQMPVETASSTAGNDHRALILADSATTSLSPYLASAFGSTMMIRHWMDDPAQSPNLPALVASYQPDVVITLLSERNLNLITPDAGNWLAAVAYDSGKQPPVGSWAPDDAQSSLTVSQPDLSSPITVAFAQPPTSALAIRLGIRTDSAGTLAVNGTAESGGFSRSLRVAVGDNILYAQIPAGLAGPLTIERTAGQGAWTATAIDVVELP